VVEGKHASILVAAAVEPFVIYSTPNGFPRMIFLLYNMESKNA
jgi:hypothetical protein